MSGLEALGALASTAQLIAYVSTLILAVQDTIAQLKDAPRRLQERMGALGFLADFLKHISKKDHLVFSDIGPYLEQIRKNVENLLSLLNSSFRQVTDRSVKRYWKAFVSHRKEIQILQSFTALECDKSSLILYLESANGCTLHHIKQQLIEVKTMTTSRKSKDEDVSTDSSVDCPNSMDQESSFFEVLQASGFRRQITGGQGGPLNFGRQHQRPSQSHGEDTGHRLRGENKDFWENCNVHGKKASLHNGHEVNAAPPYAHELLDRLKPASFKSCSAFGDEADMKNGHMINGEITTKDSEEKVGRRQDDDEEQEEKESDLAGRHTTRRHNGKSTPRKAKFDCDGDVSMTEEVDR